MFGDAGQGAVILLAGIVLSLTGKGKLLKWKPFAPILIAVGIGSTVMGLLEGSFFSFEELFVPATRTITRALFGREMDRFISIMPTGGLAKMVAFFGFSVAVGVVVNSVGIVLNIVNLARMGRKGELFFSKTGLAGAVLFWYAISLAVRALLKSRFSAWDIAPMAIPLVALFGAKPLERLVDGHRPLFPDGFFSFAVSGFVEVLETLSYYVSNTVSFLRVGAFSLSHAVLSFVVFTTSDMMRRGLPVVGVIGQWAIIVIGNAVIMVLEGMVVTIQVMRLQYYEFFSKFFQETGIVWNPFSFARIYPDKEKGDKDEA
jgi:V/A-type H+/Na+-transporting ATPase subunit I